jgi:exonuclease SbcD
MKILHTSDWHLGKSLEGFSRIEEQEEILEDIIKIVEENDVDAIVIAGDIYDTYNPPSAAERLFYKTIKKLGKGGERKIIIVSGNHDSPDRITASNILSRDHGAYVVSYPGDMNGYLEKPQEGLTFNGYNMIIDFENEILNLGLLPYPGESRLKRFYSNSIEEKEHFDGFKSILADIFNKIDEGFSEEHFNMFVGHMFAVGGDTSDSERSIQLGGTMGIEKGMFPEKADYCALGHFHKPQVISRSKNVYYSGSILPYSRGEETISKSVILIETENSKLKSLDIIPLRNVKPIEVWRFKSVDESMEYLEENIDRQVWSYIEIEMDRPLLQDEIKKMKSMKEDILSIVPIISREENRESVEFKEEKIDQVFKNFYMNTYSSEPEDDILKKFLSLVEEGEEI